MTVIHYFDGEGRLASYEERVDAQGKVTFTAGVKPAANVPAATKPQIIAYLSGLVDQRREAHARNQALATEAREMQRAAALEHRAALEAAGIPADTIDVLVPLPEPHEPVPMAVPDGVANHYERYGINADEARTILTSREV